MNEITHLLPCHFRPNVQFLMYQINFVDQWQLQGVLFWSWFSNCVCGLPGFRLKQLWVLWPHRN